jgi:hypothetical protein
MPASEASGEKFCVTMLASGFIQFIRKHGGNRAPAKGETNSSVILKQVGGRRKR